MPIPTEHDCHCEPEPRCPYCGEHQSDFWEVSGESGDHECGHCERTFMWSRYVDVTYTTSPIIGPHQLSDYTIKSEALEEP